MLATGLALLTVQLSPLHLVEVTCLLSLDLESSLSYK